MSTLDSLLALAAGKRDDAWEKSLLEALPSARVRVLSPEPRTGPDHWPYLFVSTDGEDKPGGEKSLEPIIDILAWLSSRGIGLALNPYKTTPDIVLSYGMIWNFRERGEFLSSHQKSAGPESSKIEIDHEQELLVGPPSASYLPPYARSILKQFLLDQGIMAPKIVMASFDKIDFDLCFSVESLGSPPEHEHANIAEAISWFLPSHYGIGMVSEKTIPGFQLL